MSASNIDSELEPREWHVTAKDGKLGPLTLSQVAELATSGRIAPRSLAWKSGMAIWQPCGMIPELAPLFGRIPPPAELWGARLKTLLNKLRGIEAEVRPHIERIDTSKFRLTRKQWTLAGFFFISLASFWIWRTYIHVPAHDEFIGIFMESRPADPRHELTRTRKQEEKVLNVWEDLARIEKEDGEYLLSEKMGGKWIGPQKMTPMEPKALSDLFGEEWMEFEPLGLINPTGQTAILHVPTGWEPEDFVCTTGYIILKPSGPVEILKKVVKPSVPALPTLRAKLTPTPTPEATPEPTETPEQKIIGRAQKPKAAEESKVTGPKVAELGEASAEPPASKLRLPSARTKQSRKSSAGERKLTPALAPTVQTATKLQTPVDVIIAPASAAEESASQPATVPESSAPTTRAESSVEPALQNEAPAPAAMSPPPATEARPATATLAPLTQTNSMPEATAANSPATKTEVPKPSSSDASVATAQKRAADARARLSSLSASSRTTLKEEFLKNGDAFMKTSKERATTKDTEGAVFYAERAEATFRQGELAISGGK